MKIIIILLLITFSFLFSSTCWGEWTKVISSSIGDDYYVDVEKTKRKGNYVYLWMLIDFIEPNKLGTMSQIRYLKIDCLNNRTSLLKIQTFNIPMAQGVMVDEFSPTSGWRTIDPKTVDEYLQEKSCQL